MVSKSFTAGIHGKLKFSVVVDWMRLRDPSLKPCNTCGLRLLVTLPTGVFVDRDELAHINKWVHGGGEGEGAWAV